MNILLCVLYLLYQCAEDRFVVAIQNILIQTESRRSYFPPNLSNFPILIYNNKRMSPEYSSNEYIEDGKYFMFEAKNIVNLDWVRIGSIKYV